MNYPFLVIKIGGGKGLNLANCLQDIAVLTQSYRVVIVHGVSDEMNKLCESRAIPVEIIISPSGHESRYTNSSVRDVFVEAAQNVNHQIVERLEALGIHAYGCINPRSTIIQASRKTAIRALVNGRQRLIRDDYSGTITAVDTDQLGRILEEFDIAVIPPYALSPDGFLNVDGDRASAQIAVSLEANQLIILSNIEGLYEDISDKDSLIDQIHLNDIDTALNYAQGRMKRKIIGAQEALEGGVSRVIIADGRVVNPISRALAGDGTEVFA
ncbi:[LysW]-aminoadipate kinase [Anaerolineales bacterium]